MTYFVFVRELREAMGEGMRIEAMAEKKIHKFIIDPASNGDHNLDRCLAFHKSTVRDWCANPQNEALIVTIQKHEKEHTDAQRTRMWKMLGLLESHRVLCPEYDLRPLSREGWHDVLRLRHGFIYGTRELPIPLPGGGFRMQEAPAPQPTHRGAKGRMSVAQTSEYMERIHDELHAAGISFDEMEQAA